MQFFAYFPSTKSYVYSCIVLLRLYTFQRPRGLISGGLGAAGSAFRLPWADSSERPLLIVEDVKRLYTLTKIEPTPHVLYKIYGW